jgi:hypothetical protein
MNRSKLVVASMGGAAFLSLALFAFKPDAAAGALAAGEAQYKVTTAQCDVMVATEQDACRATAKSAHDYSRRTASLSANSIPTDAFDCRGQCP